jgi:hypothetical protein
MRHALQDGALSAASFQSIFDWDGVQLSDAIQRAQEAIQRADIQPAETWRAIRTLIGTTRLLQISLKQLNAEADLVSRSFATDGLFRLPHAKNGSPPPCWFERTMVYDWREPGLVYDFPRLTLEFLRFARAEAERLNPPEAVLAVAIPTVEEAIDQRTPSPPPTKSRHLMQLRPNQPLKRSTAGEREEWRLEELARRNKHRRNTSSAESSPARSMGAKRRRNAPSVESSPTREAVFSHPAPLSSSNRVGQSASAANTQRSRFTHDFEVESEDDGEYESDGDYAREEHCENEGGYEVK